MDCIVGAGIAASAAVHAGIRVDLEMLVTLRDCTCGASIGASAAADAGIVDCVCHSNYLHTNWYPHYKPKMKKSKT